MYLAHQVDEPPRLAPGLINGEVAMSKDCTSPKLRKDLDKLSKELSGMLNTDWINQQLARGADRKRSAKVRKRLKESGLY